jgi:hypothetical protein
MATTKQKTGTDRQEAKVAIQEAAAQASTDTTPKATVAEKQVCIRLTEWEYNELKSAYAKEGVKLATGIKTSALWVYQNGGLTVTRAGIIDRRG